MPFRITLYLLLIFVATGLACQVSLSPSTPQPRTATATVAPVVPTATATVAPVPVGEAESVFCTVSVDALHLRACGSVDCVVTDWLEIGQVVEVIRPGEWALVDTGAETGYVNSVYLDCGG